MKLPQFTLQAQLEERHWWFLARRTIVRDVVHQVQSPARRGMILDVGCGTGGNLTAFQDDYTCVGFDMSPDAIRLARERFPAIRFVCGTESDELPALLAQADVCLLMDVLEHVPEDTLMLSRVVSRMRPGSHVLVTVPADISLWSGHDVSVGHYRRYDREQLVQLWAGLPVTACLVSYYNTYLYPAVKITRMVNRALGRVSGGAGTDFYLPARPVNALLTRMFASERRMLLQCLRKRRRSGFPFGVSLVAVLRVEDGAVPAAVAT